MSIDQTRAKCRVCARPYKLNKDGTIRAHWKRDGMGRGLPFSDPCDGSNKTPKGTPR